MFSDLFKRFPSLISIETELNRTVELLIETYERDGTLFVCGNGGSAADSEHVVGELLKGFRHDRALSEDDAEQFARICGHQEGAYMAQNLQYGLRAIALTGHPALATAVGNDNAPDMTFAQQLFVLGRPGDTMLALSTSGNSRNVLRACQVARVLKMNVVGMTGCSGGRLAELSDVVLAVPAEETYIIQEFHLPIYHALCAALEQHFYGSRRQ